MFFWHQLPKIALLTGTIASAALFGLRTGYFGKGQTIIVQDDKFNWHHVYLYRGLFEDELHVDATGRVDWLIHEEFWNDAPCGCRSQTVQIHRSLKPLDYQIIRYDKAAALHDQLNLEMTKLSKANKDDSFEVREAKARAALIELIDNFQ